MPASPRAGSSPTGRSTTSCSSAGRWRTPGAASAGTRCACSRPTGRAVCRATPTTARIPTATCRRVRWSRSSIASLASRARRCAPGPPSPPSGRRPTATTSAPAAARSAAGASCSPAAPATWRACRRSPPACRRRSRRSRRSTTATRIACRRAASSSSADRRPASSSPPRSSSPGRPVTLSVGEHVRLPRTYRGRDVLWWMDASGLWNQRYDEIDDLTRARRLPSPQLVGTPSGRTLDLNALAAMGVALVGRLSAIRDGRALFSGGLRNVFALADLKMERLLDHLRRVGARDRTRRRRRRARALRADARPRGLAAAARSARRRDSQHRLGDGVPPRLPLAARAGAGREGPARARGRSGRGARHVRAGPAGPAPPEIDLHPRHRGRRARRHRSPRWVSGRRNRLASSM